MLLSFTRVTLRLLALLGQVTWTGTVCFRGRVGSWGGGGGPARGRGGLFLPGVAVGVFLPGVGGGGSGRGRPATGEGGLG